MWPPINYIYLGGEKGPALKSTEYILGTHYRLLIVYGNVTCKRNCYFQ